MQDTPNQSFLNRFLFGRGFVPVLVILALLSVAAVGTLYVGTFKGDGSQLTNVNLFSVTNTPNSVFAYGAKGDGVTDDTAAIQNALYAGGSIFLGTNTYLVGNLFATNNDVICGAGATLKFKSGVTNALLNCMGVEDNLTIFGVKFDGGNYVYTVNQLGTCHGLVANAQSHHALIENCSLYGFSGYALLISGTNIDSNGVMTNSTLAVAFCHAYSNFYGGAILSPSTTTLGEYLMCVGLDCHNNFFGLELDSGNVKISASEFNKNTRYGIQMLGANNGAHGTIENCTINHNGSYAMNINGVSQGETIRDCQIRADAGGMQITSSSAIDIQGCHFDLGLDVLFVSGNSNCVVVNNSYSGPWGPGAFAWMVIDTGNQQIWHDNYSSTVSGDHDPHSGFDTNGNAFFMSAVVTNLTLISTNAAPTSVTIGTTSPDRWLAVTNNGTVLMVPTWINH